MGKNKTKKTIKFWESFVDSPIGKGAKEQIKRLKRNHKKRIKESRKGMIT